MHERLPKGLNINTHAKDLSKKDILLAIDNFQKNESNSLKKNIQEAKSDTSKKNYLNLLSKHNKQMKNLKNGIAINFTKINSYEKSINSYQVELHKKFSIPFACIIFIIIGAPLGILSRRGGFGVSISISLLFFIIYWAFLIGGEELADRGFLHPGLSMWLPNIILGLIGLYLCYIVSAEKNIINIKE